MIVMIEVLICSSHFVFVLTVIIRGRALVLTKNRGTADWGISGSFSSLSILDRCLLLVDAKYSYTKTI